MGYSCKTEDRMGYPRKTLGDRMGYSCSTSEDDGILLRILRRQNGILLYKIRRQNGIILRNKRQNGAPETAPLAISGHGYFASTGPSKTKLFQAVMPSSNWAVIGGLGLKPTTEKLRLISGQVPRNCAINAFYHPPLLTPTPFPSDQGAVEFKVRFTLVTAPTMFFCRVERTLQLL
ncbi:hypothetical protein PoB_001827500 [Plakobranchus ocellatus]|uniref:Uncharacterized protein n=1 Tax=Plakobranchus ocellatus TaxID=259542 RepID=A0AAV3Z9D2_9GAST|nr:hypothetical protein PoB_001827500 [Plakobranchus ocellatus]